MIYFKFYDGDSSLVRKEEDEVYKNYSINPNDVNLSYNAWKGTTFWRKTMLQNKI
jgi:hypothetical protein